MSSTPCKRCGNPLNPPSVNKGTSKIENKNWIQQTVFFLHLLLEKTTNFQQCSNGHCRNTLFHSDPMEPDLAFSLVQAAKIDPTILQHISINQAMANMPHNFANTNQLPSLVPNIPNPYLSQPSFNSPSFHSQTPIRVDSPLFHSQLPSRPPSLVNSPSFRSQPLPVEGPSTREVIKEMLRRPNGGIFCAKETCKSANGNRTPGHTDCTEFLCKKCCRDAALDAAVKGIHRDPCQERKHCVTLPTFRAQALRSISMPPAVLPTRELLDAVPFTQVPISEAQIGHTSPEKHGQESSERTGQQIMALQDAHDLPCPMTPTFLPPLLNFTHTVQPAPRANYALPIAAMWQTADSDWLGAKQITGNKEDRRTQTKEAVLQSRQQKMMQVTAILWYKVRHVP